MFMFGEITGSQARPNYEEWLYDDSQLVLHTTTDCNVLSGPIVDSEPAVVATAPVPQPAVVVQPNPQVAQPSGGDNVPIYLNDGGRSVWVDVQLGSLTQRMLIDTGATSISIQKSVANDLLRRGEASLEDPGQFTIADGSTHVENIIRIDTVRVGNRVLHDVIAGVTPEGASPLLGFPVLNQAGRFTIDTKNRQLIFD
jgi:clan AA aspartic protease (TIGR02281 family)